MKACIYGPGQSNSRRAHSAIGLLICASGMCVAPFWSWAGFEEGNTAYLKGDYAAAVREWTPAAQAGQSNAEYSLGLLDYEGLGVAKDYQTAFSWVGRAARQGHAAAQYALGTMHVEGKGTEVDYQVAAVWFAKAGKKGVREAQFALGRLFAYGFLGKRDLDRAAYWFELAAQKDFAPAQVELADTLLNPRYARQDDGAALRWLTRSAELGNADGQYRLAQKYESKLDYSKAMELFQNSARQGHVGSQVALGRLYLGGNHVPADNQKAFDWFCRAAAQGNSFAFYSLSTMFEKGSGPSRDLVLSTALKWVAKEVAAATGTKTIQTVPSNFDESDVAAIEKLASALETPGRFQAALDDYLKSPSKSVRIPSTAQARDRSIERVRP
jgi:TPR repeat protein